MKKLLIFVLMVAVLSSVVIAPWYDPLYNYRYSIDQNTTEWTAFPVNNTFGLQSEIFWTQGNDLTYVYTDAAFPSATSFLFATALLEMPTLNESSCLGGNVTGFYDTLDPYVWIPFCDEDMYQNVLGADATPEGSPQEVTAIFGKGMQGDGNDAIETAETGAVEEFTISLWFNTNDTSAHQFIASRDTGGANRIKLVLLSTGVLEFQTYDGSSWVTLSASGLGTDTWFHIVAMLNSTHQVLYVNGTEIDADSANTGVGLVWKYCIGGDNSAGAGGDCSGTYFKGTIDNFQLFNSTPTDQAQWVLDQYHTGINAYTSLGIEEQDTPYIYSDDDSAPVNVTELANNTYTLNVYYNDTTVTNIININYIYNITTYDVNTYAINSTHNRYNYSVNASKLFNDETDTVQSFWNYTVNMTNGTQIIVNTSNQTANTVFAYILSTFTADKDLYLAGEGIIFTLNYTNLSSLATISGWLYFNSTNTTPTFRSNSWEDNTFIPNVTVPVTTFPSYGYLSVTYDGKTRYVNLTDTISGYDFNLTICGVGQQTLQLQGYEEKTDELMNITGTINIEAWSSSSLSKLFNLSFTRGQTHNICINPNWASLDLNATIEYQNDEDTAFYNDTFDQRHHYLTNLGVTNTSQDVMLYLLNQTFDSQIIVTVTDAFGTLVDGVIVKAQRWFGDVYKSVAMGQTGDNGEVAINLEAYKYYRFILEKEGDVLRITPASSVHDNIRISYSDLDASDWLIYSSGVSAFCSVNVTDYLVCTVNNAGGTAVQGRLLVQRLGAATWSTVCDTTATGSSFTIPCLVGNTTGSTIWYRVTQLTNTTEWTLTSGFVDDLSTTEYQNVGAIALFIAITIGFLLTMFKPDIGFMVSLAMIIGIHLIGIVEFGLNSLFALGGMLIIFIIVRAVRS